MSLLDSMQSIAEAAGRQIMEVYSSDAGIGVELKEDRSPLTRADTRSHDVIAAALGEITPDIPVISEEGQRLDDEFPQHCWLVDPLDGTKEFIKRTDEFTVNIAFVEHGLPTAGVVHAPALGVSWVGGPSGAWRREGGQSVELRVARHPSIESIRVVASRDHAGKRVLAMLERLPEAQVLSMGSSLKFCLIAEGKADLYFRDGPTMEWDTAAAHALLRAAGGDVRSLDGVTLRYGKPGLRNAEFVAVGCPSLDWRRAIAGQ